MLSSTINYLTISNIFTLVPLHTRHETWESLAKHPRSCNAFLDFFLPPLLLFICLNALTQGTQAKSLRQCPLNYRICQIYARLLIIRNILIILHFSLSGLFTNIPRCIDNTTHLWETVNFSYGLWSYQTSLKQIFQMPA